MLGVLILINNWSSSTEKRRRRKYRNLGISKDLAPRVYVLRLLRNGELVLHGGRNAFVKTPIKDINGKNYNVLCGKDSGGERAVQMYKNSLTSRVRMNGKPFVHKKAFANVKSNFIFYEDLAKILNKKVIVNIVDLGQTFYKLVKKHNSNIKKKIPKNNFPFNIYTNLSKLNNLIK